MTLLHELVRKCESTQLAVHLLGRLPLLHLMESNLLAGKIRHRQVQILTQPEKKPIIFLQNTNILTKLFCSLLFYEKIRYNKYRTKTERAKIRSKHKEKMGN